MEDSVWGVWEECGDKRRMDDCEIVMDKAVQAVQQLKLRGKGKRVFLEQIYNQHKCCLEIPKQIFISQILERLRKK